jgi:hypothetical protein
MSMAAKTPTIAAAPIAPKKIKRRTRKKARQITEKRREEV